MGVSFQLPPYFSLNGDFSMLLYMSLGLAVMVRPRSVTASLAARSTLTIGYGSTSGTDPIGFYLRQGQDVDVGFLKVFLSTQYIMLEYQR